MTMCEMYMPLGPDGPHTRISLRPSGCCLYRSLYEECFVFINSFSTGVCLLCMSHTLFQVVGIKW